MYTNRFGAKQNIYILAMTTNLLTLPPPSLAAVKDSMFIGRGGRGGRGGRSRSCLYLGGEEEEIRSKTKTPVKEKVKGAGFLICLD